MQQYKVVAAHNAHEDPPIITFTVTIECDDVGALKTVEFQSDSFDEGMEMVKVYKEYALNPKNELGLMSLRIGKLWGFEVDFSKGVEVFLSELYKRHDTKDLQNELDRLPVKSNIVRDAIEKELGSRGGLQNSNAY